MRFAKEALPTNRTRKTRTLLILSAFVLLAAHTSLAQTVDDATMLALRYDGPSGIIRADATLVQIIDAELSLIRAQLPDLAGIHVFATWVPGVLTVGLTDEGWVEYQAGTYTGFDDMFSLYAIDSIDTLASFHMLIITFVEPLHTPNLADELSGVAGISFAGSSGVIGDGDDITMTVPGAYTFKHGWGDCLSGCTFNHFWQVQVADGSAVITDQWGSELPVSNEATTWGQVKAIYR